jgi:hypothetical protein
MVERPLNGGVNSSFKAPIDGDTKTKVYTEEGAREKTVTIEACLVKLEEVSLKTIKNYKDELPKDDESIQIKFWRVEDFLNQEGGRERVLTIYRNLLLGREQITQEEQSLLIEHLDFILRKGMDQDLNNPENYVSHGFKHTLNVVEYIDQIIAIHPEIIKNLEEKYGISSQQARFLMENVGLFHDFGYPESESKHLSKVNHSKTGADVINNEYTEINGRKILIKDVLVSIFNNNREIVRDLRNAVLMHNADKNDHNYAVKIITDQGEFLTEENYLLMACGRFDVQYIYVSLEDKERAEEMVEELKNSLTEFYGSKIPEIKIVDEKYPGRKLDKSDYLGLEFFKVSLTEEPLLAAIRLADNMDMAYSRLSSLQKEKLFRDYYYALGDENNLFYESNRNVEEVFEMANKAEESDLKNKALEYLRTEIARGMTTWQIYYEQKMGIITEEMGEEEIEERIHQLMTTYEAKIPKQSTAKDTISYWRNFMIDKIASPTIDPIIKFQIKEAAKKVSSLDSPHFFGCEPIIKVEITEKGIEITVDKEKYDRLNKIIITQKLKSNNQISLIKIPAGEYQIRRLYEACKNIKLRPGDIEIPIYIIEDGKNYHNVVKYSPN